MLPSLSPLSDIDPSSDNEAVNVRLSSPHFRAVVGGVLGVRIAPALQLPPAQTEAQKAGLRYERKVHKHLTSLFGDAYLASPTIEFYDQTGLRRCIPDGLILCSDHMVIVEIKSQHCAEAWWQLNLLYRPVVQKLYDRMRSPVRMLEVCKVYDPTTLFPIPCSLLSDLQSFVAAREPNFGVFRWP